MGYLDLRNRTLGLNLVTLILLWESGMKVVVEAIDVNEFVQRKKVPQRG